MFDCLLSHTHTHTHTHTHAHTHTHTHTQNVIIIIHKLSRALSPALKLTQIHQHVNVRTIQQVKFFRNPAMVGINYRLGSAAAAGFLSPGKTARTLHRKILV